MPGSISNSYETSVLTWLLTGTAPSPARPTAWHVGLFADPPGTTSDQPVIEANTTNCPGYSRKSVALSVAGSTATSTDSQTFVATGGWATVNYFGIWDAPTGGSLIAWGSINSKTLADTDQLKFDVGQITITLD